MTYIKTFEYKGQMINYFNKVKTNPKVTFLIKAFDCQLGKYTVMYSFN